MSPGESGQFPVGHPHYEILDTCGKGGMGVVYRARDERLNRVVALKFISKGDDGTESAETLARFRREAESIGSLNHPNIATLFELGDWDGTPFLAMELLAGDPLKKRLAPGTGLPMSEVMDYTRQLGAALACAHTEGILHRDIKPSNAMFNSRGTLKLLDFGLAKGIHDSDLTQTGMTVGTVSYMPPEIIAGRDATIQSDLFSFAAVVYEMAAGRTIHAGGNRGNGGSFAAGITPLRSVRPEIPVEFSDAVAKALSSNPTDRFASVTDFLSALDGAVAALDDRTRTITSPVPQPIPKRPLGWIPVVGIALVLLASAAWWWWTTGSKQVRLQTVVVLPFENLSSDPANQALCDGLQETVSGLLARAPELRDKVLVVPASELRRGQVRTISDALRQFGATMAITGSLVRSEGGLQVALNLSDSSPVRQRNSRVISVSGAELSRLQGSLGTDLGLLLGSGPLTTIQTSAGETTGNSAAYDLFLRGKGALELRAYDDAMALLAKAVDADPGFAAARAKLAETYVRKSLSTKDPSWLAMADAEVAKAAKAGPIPPVLLAQALVRKATGKSAEAVALFQQYLKADPGDPEASRFLADELLLMGRPAEAESIYLQTIRLRPGYWPLYEALGNLYAAQRQYGKSKEAFETAIVLAPKIPSLRYNLGAMYFKIGNWVAAEAAFRDSVALRPTAVAQANLGVVLFYQGKYLEAAKQTEAATVLQPSNSINWGNLGDDWWQIPNERGKARAAFERAAELAEKRLALNPEDVQIRKNYSLYLAKLGRVPEALAQARRAIQQAPKDASVRYYAARTFTASGKTPEALETLALALDLGYDPKEIEREPDFSMLQENDRYRQMMRGRQTDERN